MKKKRRMTLFLATFLALAFTMPNAWAEDLSGWTLPTDQPKRDEFCAKYQERYGYEDTDTGLYQPTYLNYVGFTRYIARDGGVADGMQYTLHGSVSAQNLEDYIAYLGRFGYDVAFDASQNGVRLLELRNIDTPDYLPVSYRIYYDIQDQSIVTVDSIASEAAFEKKALESRSHFREELNQPKTLASGVTVTLLGAAEAASYEMDNIDAPTCDDTFPSLAERSILMPLPTKILADQTAVGVITPPEDANHQEPDPYWLLHVRLDTAGTSLKLDDLEFCLATDDVIVAFPLQSGASLEQDGNVPLLRMNMPARVQGVQELWLAFSGLSSEPNCQVRLYASYAADREPLMERVSFGFFANASTDGQKAGNLNP